MRTLNTILFMVLIVFITTASGQQIVKCDSARSFWIIEKSHVNYSVMLHGDVITKEMPSVVSVNGAALQELIVDKDEYIGDKGANSDLEVLIRYAKSEADYTSEQFKSKIDLHMQRAEPFAGKTVLLWFYEMPPKMNRQVKCQLYVNTIIGKSIIGLASPQFDYQNFDDVRQFLLDTIGTLRVIRDKDQPCKQ